MPSQEHGNVVASFLGRDIGEGELMSDVVMEVLAALAVRVYHLEQMHAEDTHDG